MRRTSSFLPFSPPLTHNLAPVSDDGLSLLWGSRKAELADLEEVRIGQKSDSFAKNERLRQFSAFSFTYIFHAQDPLDFIASSDVDFLLYTTALRFVAERKRDPRAFFIQRAWADAVGKRDAEIGVKDIISLLSRLNFYASASFVKCVLAPLCCCAAHSLAERSSRS